MQTNTTVSAVSNLSLYLLIPLAFVLWFVMFSPWTAPHINFWIAMTASATILAGSSLIIDRRLLRERYSWKNEYVLIGLVSAAILYGVFYAGNEVSRLILNSAGHDIANIYSTKTQASPAVIGLLLFFWVGPAEEIFWRGFVQTRLSILFGQRNKKVSPVEKKHSRFFSFSEWSSDSSVRAFIATSLIYALVHISAFNLMLFGAALVCGLFWGAMYLKYRSVWPGLISHAIWDLAIFVLWPVGS